MACKYIKQVGLVRKLRETRALVGFSRNMPRVEREDGLQPLSLGADIDWLPAIEVRGEGIFIEFDADAITKWKGANIDWHVAHLISRYNDRRVDMKLSRREVDARFLLLHAIAHALIKELTFTCGYGSASLRERLYCNVESRDKPMNGILIYTASGDFGRYLGRPRQRGQARPIRGPCGERSAPSEVVLERPRLHRGARRRVGRSQPSRLPWLRPAAGDELRGGKQTAGPEAAGRESRRRAEGFLPVRRPGNLKKALPSGARPFPEEVLPESETLFNVRPV